jgi:hypothetical protein
MSRDAGMAGKARSELKSRKSRLKVFRTAIGFHDAYVAAPSRKAALAAWGTDKDLFARGVADEVTDPALMKESLSAPGTVFRQLRAMPADEPEAKPRKTRKAKAPGEAPVKNTMQPVPTPPAPPRPSKEKLGEAQQALKMARKQHEQEQRELAARERELTRDRKDLEDRQARELRRLQDQLDAASRDFEGRVEHWRKATKEAERA